MLGAVPTCSECCRRQTPRKGLANSNSMPMQLYTGIQLRQYYGGGSGVLDDCVNL